MCGGLKKIHTPRASGSAVVVQSTCLLYVQMLLSTILVVVIITGGIWMPSVAIFVLTCLGTHTFSLLAYFPKMKVGLSNYQLVCVNH
jgi:hypothetical protein